MRFHQMKSLLAAFAFALALGGCSRDSAPSAQTSLTEPAARTGVNAVRFSSANGRAVVTTVSASGRGAAIRSQSAKERDVAARMLAFAKKAPPALVLVDRPLDDSAIAEVYLNSTAATPRFIVISRAALNDETIDRAYALVKTHEMEHPNDVESVKFSLSADGDYIRTSAQGVIRAHQMFQGFYASGKKDRRSRWLLLSSERVPATTIPGIGSGRIMSLGDPHIR